MKITENIKEYEKAQLEIGAKENKEQDERDLEDDKIIAERQAAAKAAERKEMKAMMKELN